MNIRHEVIPFLIASAVTAGIIFAASRLSGVSGRTAAVSAGVFCIIACGYFVYFFRDPERTPLDVPGAVLAGADGKIAAIRNLSPEEFKSAAPFHGLNDEQVEMFLKPDVVRISIFLSLFDVHVNRAPISGKSKFLGYFPGKHFFTFQEKSSDVNQHNSILITGESTCCLLTQIVGPVCRRVVYWPDHEKEIPIRAGEKIGMMKFGSRLDMYFPRSDIRPTVKEGDSVAGGLDQIAEILQEKQ